MEQSISALTGLRVQWKTLTDSRPSELDFGAFGYPGLDAQKIDEQFEEWEHTLSTLGGQQRWMETADALLSDRQIATWIGEISAATNQAAANGVAWAVANSPLLDRIGSVSARVAAISQRRVDTAKALARLLEKRGVDEIGTILEAATEARSIINQQSALKSAVESIAQSNSKAGENLANLEALKADLDERRAQIEHAHASVSERFDQVELLYGDVKNFRANSAAKAEELSQKLTELTGAAESAQKTTVEVHASLRKALINVRKEGLAGAFTERGRKVGIERLVWVIVFVGAVAGLTGLAAHFAANLTVYTYEALIVALLRRAALAAPLVWLGWYSAKQLGRLGRIQEDYEYKAATALAFQSYKVEADDIGSDELVAELLRRAIVTFGDNPVRLYEHAKADPASPMSDLVKTLEKDETFKMLKIVRDFFAKNVA